MLKLRIPDSVLFFDNFTFLNEYTPAHFISFLHSLCVAYIQNLASGEQGMKRGGKRGGPTARGGPKPRGGPYKRQDKPAGDASSISGYKSMAELDGERCGFCFIFCL